jgi:hypothetical protein
MYIRTVKIPTTRWDNIHLHQIQQAGGMDTLYTVEGCKLVTT